MVDPKDIQATCDDIVREFAPLKIILFGSYAHGTPTEDSDVDLLVVMPIPESQTRRQAVEIRRRIPRRFRMDVVVRSPEEIAYRISHNDWFLREVTQEGQVLYESAPGMGTATGRGATRTGAKSEWGQLFQPRFSLCWSLKMDRVTNEDLEIAYRRIVLFLCFSSLRNLNIYTWCYTRAAFIDALLREACVSLLELVGRPNSRAIPKVNH